MSYFLVLIVMISILIGCDKSIEQNTTQIQYVALTSEDTLLTTFRELSFQLNAGNPLDSLAVEYLFLHIKSIMKLDTLNRSKNIEILHKLKSQSNAENIIIIDWDFKFICESYPNDFFKLPSNILSYYSMVFGEEFATESENPIDESREFISRISHRIDKANNEKLIVFGNEIYKTINERK